MHARHTSTSFILIYLVQLVLGEPSPFTKVGWPACYISKSYNQDVNGLFNRCYQSRLTTPGYLYDVGLFWSYCSTDHNCCYHNGYPACCKVRTGFSDWELAGLVIGCVVFVAVILGIALYISKRFCTKDDTD